MARLINVDALLNELQTKFDRAERDAEFTGSRVIKVSWNDAICAIKQAEIVEAISIEWLKEYEVKNGQEVRLQSAIEEWEKENETN